MINVIAYEMCVRAQRMRRLLVLLRAEVHDRRKVLALFEAAQNVHAVTVFSVFTAEQNHVVASAGKFIGQVPGRGRVIRENDCVGPVRGDVVHEECTKVRMLVDDHEFDTHRT